MSEIVIRDAQRSFERLVSETRELREANTRLVAENEELKKQLVRYQQGAVAPQRRNVPVMKNKCLVLLQSYLDTERAVERGRDRGTVDNFDTWILSDEILQRVPLPAPKIFDSRDKLNLVGVNVIFYMFVVSSRNFFDNFAGLSVPQLMLLFDKISEETGSPQSVKVVLIPFFSAATRPFGEWQAPGSVTGVPPVLESYPLEYGYVGRDNYNRPTINDPNLSNEFPGNTESLRELRRIKRESGCDE